MDAFDSFRKSVEPFLPTWKSLEVRAIGDKESETLVSLVACLTPNNPHEPELEESIPGIVFIREALTVPVGFSRFLSGLQEGTVTMGSKHWSTVGFSEPQWTDISDSRDDDFRYGWPDLQEFRSVSLAMQGGRDLQQILSDRRVSDAVRTFGFTMFSEMTLDRLGFRVGNSYVTRANIYAPLLADIHSEAGREKLRVRVRLHNRLSQQAMSFSFRTQDRRGTRLGGGRVDAGDLETRVGGDFVIVEWEISIPDGTVSGEVQLFHSVLEPPGKPIAIARFVVPPPADAVNPRWASAMSVIEGTPKWTKAGMAPEQVVRQWLGLEPTLPQNDQDFERGVSVLLFATGLEVLPIGDADGVDHVVMPLEGTPATLVSCTITSNLRNKIGRVKEQKNRLGDVLNAANVNAAIFVPRDERDMLVGDIQECMANGVGLFLRSDIKGLFDTATGPDWTRASSLFQSLVENRRFLEMRS